MPSDWSEQQTQWRCWRHTFVLSSSFLVWSGHHQARKNERISGFQTPFGVFRFHKSFCIGPDSRCKNFPQLEKATDHLHFLKFLKILSHTRPSFCGVRARAIKDPRFACGFLVSNFPSSFSFFCTKFVLFSGFVQILRCSSVRIETCPQPPSMTFLSTQGTAWCSGRLC